MPGITFRSRRFQTFVFASLTCVFLSLVGYAETNEFKCKVISANVNKDAASTIGEFTVSSAKQGLLRKAFRLPTTDSFVNSAVFLKNEFGANDDAIPTKMYLILAIGKREYPRIELNMKNSDVRTNAMTRGNINGMHNLEVSTTFLGRGEPLIITLACRN